MPDPRGRAEWGLLGSNPGSHSATTQVDHSWGYYPDPGQAPPGQVGWDDWLWPAVTVAGWTVEVHDGAALAVVAVSVHDGVGLVGVDASVT